MAVEAGRPGVAVPRPAVHDGRTNQATTAAKRLVAAVVARDHDDILAALARDARLRYLTPGGQGQCEGAAQVAAKFLQWFGDAEVLEVQSVRIEPLADRTSAQYRFLLHNHDRWEVVEQHLCLDTDQARRVAAIDLLCSGFRLTAGPEAPRPSGTHQFDAGTMGCADGLAQEFRRRILAIPPGDVLVIQTSDPAAKQDLPPLARMMGHTVRSIEPSAGGRLLLTVERGR